MELSNPTDVEWDQLEALEFTLFDNNLSASSLRREFASGTRIWLEYEENSDVIIGYMLVREEDGVADILRLGVCPENQGKGVGSRLLVEAKKTFPRLMLCVRKVNRGAFKLYKRFGFSIAGDLGNAWTMVTWSTH